MNQHLTQLEITQLSTKTLPRGQYQPAGQHLAACETCWQRFRAQLRASEIVQPPAFTLAPEFWFRHDHLNFEDLVKIADRQIGSEERETVTVHLRTCGTCKENLTAFLTYRKQIEPELQLTFAPTAFPAKTNHSSWAWLKGTYLQPSHIAAILIISLLGLGSLLLLSREAQNTISTNLSASPSPTQNSNVVAEVPTPLPLESPATVLPLITLNDSKGPVTIYSDDTLTGLEDIPTAMRQQVAQVLLSERFQRPEVLQYLAPEDGSLRGREPKDEAFRLISPSRKVLIEDRPEFRWDGLGGATGYQVSVLDVNGHEVAKSDPLSASTTRWKVDKALKRGEVFSWLVIAKLGENEIASPSASAPEMRFAVLSTKNLHQLNKLRMSNSHLALTVFYANTGLIADAEQELKKLAQQNPRSSLAAKLIRSLDSFKLVQRNHIPRLRQTINSSPPNQDLLCKAPVVSKSHNQVSHRG